MVAFPALVRVTVCALLAPTTILPKLRLPGLALSVLPLSTALPVRANVCGELLALSLKTMLPVAPALDVGAKETLKARFFPVLTVTGNTMPLIAKPLPETLAESIWRFELPLFLSVTV